MTRDLFIPHKLFYNRKPSLAKECYQGVRDAVEPEHYDISESEEYKVFGVKQELLPSKQDDPDSTMIRENGSSRGFHKRFDQSSRVHSRESINLSYNPSPTLSADHAGDPRIFRKARYVFPSSRSPTKWPVSLELEGKRIVEQTNASTPTSETKQETIVNSSDDSHKRTANENVSTVNDGVVTYLPPLSKSLMRNTGTPSKARKVTFSPSFYSDYGLRSEKSDTFSGLRHQQKRERTDLDIVKLVQEKANRHIYACQNLSNSRRGSRAALGVTTLKETVGPLRASTASNLPTKKIRTLYNQSPDRQATFVDVSKRAPFSLFIRTRESPDYSRIPRHKTAPLPEINGQMLVLGFDDYKR